MEQGYVQVYTGDGKGKTTAALGLAMRAAGAGYNVFIAQFVKGRDSSELRSFANISDRVIIRQYGRSCWVTHGSDPEDTDLARRGLAEVLEAVRSGRYKLVILDEANIAIHLGLFEASDILSIIDNRPGHVELVITGRYVDREILDRADLVTEMREIKHYFQNGVMARAGIEN